MNEDQISQYITATFAGVNVAVASGDSFFTYDPDLSLPPDHWYPFATLVTSDFNDQFSNLNRPSVFRLNIGIGKQTFHALFAVPTLPTSGEHATESESSDPSSTYDFTALNQVMPHPIYGRMYWICVLNPSDELFATHVRPLLAEAYAMAVSKYPQQSVRSAATKTP